jgi:hypothetical protein
MKALEIIEELTIEAAESPHEFLRHARRRASTPAGRAGLLLNYLRDNPELSFSGKVTNSSRDCDATSTEFTLEADGYLNAAGDESRSWDDDPDLGKLLDQLQADVESWCHTFNRGMEKAFYKELEYRQSEEALTQAWEANETTFDEEGNISRRGIPYDQLSPEAKEHALSEYRDWDTDDEHWSEYLREDFEKQLDYMGFHNAEILYSLNYSQGDGVVFTTSDVSVEQLLRRIIKGNKPTDVFNEPLDEAAENPHEFLRRVAQREKAKKEKAEREEAERRARYSIITRRHHEDAREWPEWDNLALWEQQAILEFQEAVGISDFVQSLQDQLTVEAEDGNEYVIYRNDGAAEGIAVAEVRDLLDDDPSSFSSDFLMSHIDEDYLRRELASGEEDSTRDAYSEEYPDYDDKKKFLIDQDYLDEDDFIDEEGNDRELDGPLEDKIENAFESFIEDVVEKRLRDPVSYLSEMYGDDELMKQIINMGALDLDEAAQAAVDADGWQHFLSHWDGNSDDLPSGAVYIRR